MSKKIKVLVVPSDRTGVGSFRSIDPHIALEKYYSDEFRVEINYEPWRNRDSYWQDFDILHFHRGMGDWGNCLRLLEDCKKWGIVTIMDIDDFWMPGPEHPAHSMIVEEKINLRIVENIKAAQYVTTTTDEFVKEITPYNKNVEVFPNAIDPSKRQFTPNPEKSDILRVGWLGGSSHLHDLNILKDSIQKLKADPSLKDRFQMVLCGFDTRGSMTTIDPEGKKHTRKIEPKESVWALYEQIMTGNYDIIKNKEEVKQLLEFTKGKPSIKTSEYRRVWTKPITTYATNYNLMDVSIAPLKETTFNRVKSQLKIIEAGFHKKAIIAQDFGPYKIDCVHGKNSLLVPTSKNHKWWYKHLKTLINNPNMVKDLGEQLYEDVQKYHIKAVTKTRAEWYRSLIKK
jgi:glycosyltransferase involved in cell wall biosynthesis|tara:strand:- start:340 stop:1536 length:1197 start_codon:yes stop_codon:yes gene_type:complete